MMPLTVELVDADRLAVRLGNRPVAELSVSVNLDQTPLHPKWTVDPKNGHRWTAQIERESLSLEAKISGQTVSFQVRLHHAGEAQRLLSFTYSFAQIATGNTEAKIHVPGPYFPSTYIRPGSLVSELKDKRISLHSTPDGGFGLITVYDERAGVAVWPESTGDTRTVPVVEGTNHGLKVQYIDHREAQLKDGQTVEGTPIRLCCFDGADSVDQALNAYQKWSSEQFPLAKDRASWIHDAVILEAMPAYYPGGFRGLESRLAEYHEIGINTIYLMPHWLGGYMPIDFRAVDPAMGTEADLRSLIDHAHKSGMRVLFDLVIHGMSPDSPMVRDHPELFCREADGGLMRHPTWKSVSTDWRNPKYLAEMADLARGQATKFKIDGYRVDAAGFKGPNWDPELKEPAYWMGSGAPEVIRAMRQALRETRPEGAMLNEVFGPAFQTVCDFVHDNQTEGVEVFLERLAAGMLKAADYAEHLRSVLAITPPDATRVFFARNHDTSWFYRFHGYTPEFLAIDAVHAFLGAPEVFGGDPGHGPSPDADPVVWSAYRKIFAQRKATPELVYGSRVFHGVTPSSQDVIAFVREQGSHRSLVLASLSGTAIELRVDLPFGARPGALHSLFSGELVPFAIKDRSISVTIPAHAVLVGRL